MPANIPPSESPVGPPAAEPETQLQPDDVHESNSPIDAQLPSVDPSTPPQESYVFDLADELLGSVPEKNPANESSPTDHHPLPGDEFELPTASPRGKNAAAVTGADRRTHPRYKFVAPVELVEQQSGARIETRVRDLSRQGCYIDTNDVLPLGTATNVRITKGTQLFEARARVVYSRASQGMGLMFTSIAAERLQILDTWLAESRETSWLAANRRRSDRVLMTIPVRVSGHTALGSPFEEKTHTAAISAHGALIPISTQVSRGERLNLTNAQTNAALECLVVHIAKQQGSPPHVGVEFLLPNPIFWHIAFPPKDWTPRHPDAKSRL